MIQEEIDSKSKCCANCVFFDSRTQFCRLNPPQVVMQYVNKTAYPAAVWPKISVPTLDFCSHFDNINKQKII